MFVISYTVIFYVRLSVYDMFHILLSCDSLKDLWNVYMYACIYVCTYVFMYVICEPESRSDSEICYYAGAQGFSY